jgi:hypothetical protein
LGFSSPAISHRPRREKARSGQTSFAAEKFHFLLLVSDLERGNHPWLRWTGSLKLKFAQPNKGWSIEKISGRWPVQCRANKVAEVSVGG